MTATPPTETYDLDLSLAERWVVHHLLVTHVDDLVDEDRSPPEWALRAIDAVESDALTVTTEQAARLAELLDSYVDTSTTPEADVVCGLEILDRLESIP